MEKSLKQKEDGLVARVEALRSKVDRYGHDDMGWLESLWMTESYVTGSLKRMAWEAMCIGGSNAKINDTGAAKRYEEVARILENTATRASLSDAPIVGVYSGILAALKELKRDIATIEQ